MTDSAARTRALHPGASILLQAPAGSGKTTVLAQRFLALLAGAAQPEELLAITFTRKAAAEMRERVQLALEGALDDSPGGNTWRALREAALAQALRQGWPVETLGARLRIQTIDSLNHEIARAMPVLGRFQGSLQVVDDATPLHAEAARRTLRKLDEEPDGWRDADILLQRLDNNEPRAQELLASLLQARARWLPLLLAVRPEGLAEAVVASLARIVRETLARAATLPAAVREEGAALARASAVHRDAAGHADGPWRYWLAPDAGPGTDLASLEGWRAMADLALTGEDTLRKLINKNAGFPATEKALKARWKDWIDDVAAEPAVQAMLLSLRRLPPPWLDEDEKAAIAAVGRVLLRAAAELSMVFRERGRVDHTQISGMARQALVADGEPTEQGIRETLRIRHLLVDEFQDVSPEQLHLVEVLTSGWSVGDGRSLFFVGDPMQSIYLFRQSEVGLFLRTRHLGVGGLPLEFLQLQRNFRSLPALVQWSNTAFREVFPAQQDLRASAVSFLESAAARADDDGAPAVQVLALSQDDAAVESAWIARQIRAHQQAHPRHRIAVLMRDRGAAPAMLAALRAARIPVRGVDLASLAQHPTVQDLVALGAALLDAADRIAWLAVLRSPCCGIALADLHALCGDDANATVVSRLADEAAWSGLSEDGRERLARCAPLLLDAWTARQRQDPATQVEDLWRRLGGAQTCDRAALHAARQYLTALRRRHEEGGAIDAAELLGLAARLRDTPEELENDADSAPPVEVLTIHHSKGLEWDVVFVPGLGRPARTDAAPLMRWLELPAPEGGEDLLLAVHSIGRESGPDPLSRYIAGLQEERLHNERMRLAYVAITRARERLVLSGHVRVDAEGQAQPMARSMLRILWPALAPHFASPRDPATLAGEVEPTGARGAAWQRVARDFDPRSGCVELPRVTSLGAGVEHAAPQPEFAWVGPAARAAGTVAHGVFEQLAGGGDWQGVDSRASLRAYGQRLAELGVVNGEAQALARQLGQRLRHLAQDELARWVLSAGHAESHSELRLTGLIDGVMRNVVIDRSFVDAQGQRWVIDYKTSTHHGGGLEEFLQREIERYAPQLRGYVALAGRLGPQPVRAALYFPWIGVLRTLEGDHSPAIENG